MAVRLVSVSKPATESEAIRPKALVERAATRVPSATMDVPAAALRRLAVGKSFEPIAPRGGIGLETVLGLDERTRIVSTETLPWKLVCALEIDAPWGGFVGTGWFARPRTLVTAGHCVFDARQMGGWAREIRVEHWVVAESMGQTVARNILGGRERFDAVPFFWSQHCDVVITYVGHAEHWGGIEIDGDIAAHDCTLRYLMAGKLAAVATIFRDRESLEAEVAMERAILTVPAA